MEKVEKLVQGKAYQWVKIQVLGKADNFVNASELSFGDRMSFLNGVRWLLAEMEKQELLGVLSEVLEYSRPDNAKRADDAAETPD